MDAKKVLTHLIRAARDAIHLERTLDDLGYKETPYYDLYGEISEAIYGIVGEDTEEFDESVTYNVIHDQFTPDELSAEELASMIKEPATSGLPLLDETREVIAEAAKQRNIDTQTMTNLILSEWAMKEMFYAAMIG